MIDHDGSDGMQAFYRRQGVVKEIDQPMSKGEAALHLSGYAVLPWFFVWGALTGPRTGSPTEFAVVIVGATWGVLTIKYLPLTSRAFGDEGLGARAVFREALECLGVIPDRWGFLWYISMATMILSIFIYYVRFVL